VLHPDLVHLRTTLGLDLTGETAEPDNAEYGALLAHLRGVPVRFRVAKVTPRKVGLFVTTWRRAADGGTEPFPADEPVAGLVVVTREDGRFGAFLFPRAVLADRGVLAGPGAGKRGFRVYPSWSVTTNRTARVAQAWQTEHFVDLTEGSDAGRLLAALTAAPTSAATGSP
jgi:hypothetical protein